MDEIDLIILRKLLENARMAYRELAELLLENRTLELVKEYSNDFIEFIINNKKKRKKNY